MACGGRTNAAHERQEKIPVDIVMRVGQKGVRGATGPVVFQVLCLALASSSPPLAGRGAPHVACVWHGQLHLLYARVTVQRRVLGALSTAQHAQSCRLAKVPKASV